jgi:hypothetical protein
MERMREVNHDGLGCIATGKTIEQMRAALALHLQSMLEDNEELPKPRGIASYVDAVSGSEGEEYFLTHIALESVLPDRVSV